MMKLASIAAACLIFATAHAAAQHSHGHGHRHAKAHTHGKGKLNIAVEGNKIAMALEVPGADIVGFEHEAKTDKQKEAVEKAKAKLADALSLFKLSVAADCKLTEAKIEVHGEKDAAKKNDKEKHSEFHADIVLDCKAPASLTTITFDYFKTFPKADALEITIVTPKGQNKYEVTRKKPVLTFAVTS